MATIRELAKMCGVSPATVSRVLNHDETISVSKETRKRIFETAELVSYQKPSRSKKDDQSSYTVGLVHWFDELQELNDPYFISIRMGIEELCNTHAIQLIKIFNSDTLEANFPQVSLDGLIVLGKFPDEHIEQFKKYAPHIVFIHSNEQHFDYDCVKADFTNITLHVLQHIVDKGHTRIGFIGGHEILPFSNTPLEDEREQTFKDYLTKIGLYNPDYVLIGSFDFHSGYTLMGQLLKSCKDHLPTCIFAASDTLAIGALRAINEAGLSVPKDIKIIGCNDIPTSQYTSPTLSTIKIYTELMGQIGIKLLLERISGERTESLKVTVPHKIILRESFNSFN
ncbi:LacI family DNA-binding transcriptional regulator [Niameybacter massiliensis]|uniref:LacI family DNA-binding transcriptional regulator n=1 Tax=Niameybacter massiliensis TaxID=1658108 RepID=UPI0006B47BF9|nr:LacI family DNA-binding transcriptional regulator [Niameybacter massiliensis]